jgi:hypothetical protein
MIPGRNTTERMRDEISLESRVESLESGRENIAKISGECHLEERLTLDSRLFSPDSRLYESHPGDPKRGTQAAAGFVSVFAPESPSDLDSFFDSLPPPLLA